MRRGDPLPPLAAAIGFNLRNIEFGGKFLRRFFQKATAVKGAKPLSRSAEREILLPRFFLLAFSLRVLPAKKKRLTIYLN